MQSRGRRHALRKADAEALLDAIDQPELIDVLAVCVERLLGPADGSDDPDGRSSRAPWPELVERAALMNGWSADRRSALAARDRDELQQLALDLAELRRLP